MPKKFTIVDIARLAGVSRTTVSRVLNERPDVDRETREKVLRVIAEHGYVPNPAAAGLAAGRSRLVGMVVPSFTWPIIPEIIRGIASVISRTDYELVLYSFNDEKTTPDRSDIINKLLGTQLTAGIIAVFPSYFTEQLTRLYQQGVPVVAIDDQQEQRVPWVRVDNISGARQATRHLIGLGHTRIAHIMGPVEYLASHDRATGYQQALQEASITPDADLLLPGDFLPTSGRDGAEQLFNLPPEQRPTAIFTATDQQAYGVLAAAEAHGMTVPRDIALVGFDDDAPSAFVHPPLTTVRQPAFEMGHTAIELLLPMLDRDPDDDSALIQPDVPIPCIQLPTSLIVRASCGAVVNEARSTWQPADYPHFEA
jgi:LacI family transcriptional regulator